MWEELTVKEHVQIFEALKRTAVTTTKDSKQEVLTIIEACGLTIKNSARVKTLSGGQKRRAQLGKHHLLPAQMKRGSLSS